MQVRVVVKTEPEKRQIVSVEGDVTQDGDLSRLVSQAIGEARELGMQPWGWSLSVDKVE